MTVKLRPIFGRSKNQNCYLRQYINGNDGAKNENQKSAVSADSGKA